MITDKIKVFWTRKKRELPLTILVVLHGTLLFIVAASILMLAQETGWFEPKKGLERLFFT